MSRPIYEPSLPRADAENAYGNRQLFRRPARQPRVATLHIKVFPDEFFDVSFPITVGDYKFIFAIAEDMDEMRLTRAEAFVTTVSTAGDVIVSVWNRTISANMLTDPLQVDEGEKNSMTSSAPVDIVGNPVFWGHEIAIGIIDPGTDAFGLGVILEFTR